MNNPLDALSNVTKEQITPIAKTKADEIVGMFLPLFSELPISEEEKKKWIQDAIKKEGSLRKSMKVKEGKKIPVEKLKKAAKEKGKKGKRARLALTLRKLNK